MVAEYKGNMDGKAISYPPNIYPEMSKGHD